MRLRARVARACPSCQRCSCRPSPYRWAATSAYRRAATPAYRRAESRCVRRDSRGSATRAASSATPCGTPTRATNQMQMWVSECRAHKAAVGREGLSGGLDGLQEGAVDRQLIRRVQAAGLTRLCPCPSPKVVAFRFDSAATLHRSECFCPDCFRPDCFLGGEDSRRLSAAPEGRRGSRSAKPLRACVCEGRCERHAAGRPALGRVPAPRAAVCQWESGSGGCGAAKPSARVVRRVRGHRKLTGREVMRD
eukprot:3287117-Prymnesium_polylepis.1